MIEKAELIESREREKGIGLRPGNLEFSGPHSGRTRPDPARPLAQNRADVGERRVEIGSFARNPGETCFSPIVVQPEEIHALGERYECHRAQSNYCR